MKKPRNFGIGIGKKRDGGNSDTLRNASSGTKSNHQPITIMKTRSIRFLFPSAGAARALGWLVLAAVAGWPLSSLQALPFTVTGLTEIKGEGVVFEKFNPADVNDSGQVVGTATFADGSTRAVLFHNGVFTDLGQLGSVGSQAVALNNAGHVVGTSFVRVTNPRFPDSEDFARRAFLHNGETMIDLGTLPVFEPATAESTAIAINDAGQIIGLSDAKGAFSEDSFGAPFLFEGVGMTELPIRPSDINESGQIVGIRKAVNNLGFENAFLLDGGTLIDLHLLVRGDDVSIGSSSKAIAINKSGQVVGIHVPLFGPERRFLFDHGEVTLLPFDPLDINDHGHILGSARVMFDGENRLLRDLAASFLTEGTAPGFQSLAASASFGFRGPYFSNRFIVGVGRFFDGTSLSDRPFLLSFTTGETKFVWEGAEGFEFNHAPNWTDGVVPGEADTVELTDPQLKKIEFESGDLVVNRRLVVTDRSRTEVDLNESVWRIESETDASPDAAGQVLLRGGQLTLENGLLEVFGKAIARNDGPADNGLSVRNGGRFIVRANALEVGAGLAGSRASFLTATGQGSAIVAEDMVLGSGGAGGSTATISDGAALVADRKLTVGTLGGSSAGLLVRGPGSPFSSSLQIGEGGALDIGTDDSEGTVRIIDGATAVLDDVTVTLGGSALSNGLFSLAGENSRVQGGAFHVREGGHLHLADVPASVPLISVEGGEALLHRGFSRLGEGGRFEVSAGTLAMETGAFAKVDALAMTGGRLTLSGGSRLRVLSFGEEGAEDILRPVTMKDATVSLDTGSEMQMGDLTLKGNHLTGGDLITVRGGSTLEVGDKLRIAAQFGEFGEVRVSGANSKLVTKEAAFGLFGSARLLVEDGASATFETILISSPSDLLGGEISRIDVRGAGTRVVSGNFDIFGAGVLTVDTGASFEMKPGSKLSTDGILFLFSTSHLGNLEIRETGDAVIGGTTVTAESVQMRGGSMLITKDGSLVTPTFRFEGRFLEGAGRIVGHLIQTGGRIQPGTSPGVLTVEGDYTQQDGTLVIEIGGTAPGTQHDQLVVTGNANFTGGTVELAFSDGFAPRAGQTFTFLDVDGSVTGSASFTVSGLEPGWEFNTTLNPATGTYVLNSLSDGVANAANFPDQDDDGLPNDWEIANGLDPNDRADASRDPDGDGQSNLDEYRAGTDPRSATSAFALLSVQPYLGGYLLTYTAQSGKTYRVTGSTDLKTWSQLLPPSPSTATGPLIATIPAAQATALPFFRIEIVP